jgi:hypothetical protein
MYTTDKQFAHMLIQTNIDHNILVDAAIVASKLLKRYGQAIYSSGYTQAIQETSPEAAAILIAAKNAGKSTAEKLRHIVKILKNTAENYQPHFVVHGRTEVIKELESFVHKQQKDAHVDQHTTQDDELTISGEGFYYKRSVEKDTRTILGLYN